MGSKANEQKKGVSRHTQPNHISHASLGNQAKNSAMLSEAVSKCFTTTAG